MSRLWLSAATLFLAAAATADTIERRGTEPSLEGTITNVDDNGVTVSSASGAAHIVPWDRIRRVTPARPAIDEFAETAEMLWRARTRLERQDAPLAEPLFERLFERYRGRTHETALIVAEGLLRCRLSRGAHGSAVLPALEAARLRRAKIASPSYRNLPRVLDEHTSLCMTLAPAWVVDPSLVALEHDLAAYDAKGDVVIAAQAALYRRAVRAQLQMPPQDDPRNLAADHPGVMLLRAIVEVSASDSAQRESGREALARDLAALPPWAQAWAHYAIGASLAAESGLGRQESGMVGLAHLPAHFAAEQPYLAGMALDRLASMSQTLGYSASAASLRAELASRFPGHPVLAAARRPVGGVRGTTSTTTKESS